MGLSYLLARLADTLTDSGSWSLEERLSHLERFENAILRSDPKWWKLSGSLGKFSDNDARLLAEGADLLVAYRELPSLQRDSAVEVLKTLIHGMKWDLKTFSGASVAAPIFGVKDFPAFDWYCFSIAGCVGRFWTQIFSLPTHLELLAVAYGKALQRINILRDVREDWQRGRVYLPQNLCDVFEFGKGEPWRHPRWREFCKSYIQETRELLLQGAFFCDSIPRGSIRLRFASMMPLLIGFKTLDALERAGSWEERIKISRRDVKRLGIVALTKALFGAGVTPWARKFLR